MATQFEGRRVAWLVLLLVALTAVIPPAAAYALAQWRITRAEQGVADTAHALAARKPELQSTAGTQSIVCGPGNLPRAEAAAREWIRSPVSAPAAFATVWPQDSWGQCYLLNVRALFETGSGLLISAGPNGTIETPLGATAPAGDDIAATVR